MCFFVSIKSTFQDNFITNLTVCICVLQSNVVLKQELCVKFSLTYVAIRLTFFVVLSKVSLESICFTENFATILAGSTSPPSGVHRLTVCSALKNGHLLCRIEHFHFLDGILTSLCIFYSILYTVLSLSWTVCEVNVSSVISKSSLFDGATSIFVGNFLIKEYR